jgi:hypothetical protein
MEELRMTKKELNKIDVLALISKGKMKMKKGAEELGITKRHLRRLRRRYEEEGGKGLAHRSRGRRSRNSFEVEFEEKIIELLHSRYSDFGPTFAAEKLSEDLRRKVSKEKIRQLQIREGLRKARKVKEKKYHPRRARRSRRGELIQIDGSEHDWLEGRGPRMSLIVFIDDATSEIPIGKFVEAETTKDYMKLTKEYVDENGLPLGIYSDKHSIFRQNQKEGHLRGELTQYGRALKELGIELICAHSPQAKGRIERSFGTHQDRLVKELRLAKIDTLEEANKFLEGYLKKHNKCFAVEPLIQEDAHRKKPEKTDLNRVFSKIERRVLSKGLSFGYKTTLYQVKNPKNVNRLQNQKIEILETLDNKIIVETLKGESIEVVPYYEYTGEIQRTIDTKEIGSLWVNKKPNKPKKNHPWR